MNHEAIVIGGGISGCAAAYYLAQSGMKPTLFERDGIAAHASGFAFGMVSAQFDADASVGVVEKLLTLSVDLHHSLAKSLNDGGRGYTANPKAALRLAFDDSDVATLRPAGVSAFRNNRRSRDHRDVRWLAYGELSHIEARVSPEVIGALYVGGQLEINPGELTNALWDSAKAKAGGEKIDAEVEEVRVENGRVTGVKASDGRHDSDVVVLAAGPWSGDLLKRGSSTSMFNLPVIPLKGEIVRFDIGDEPPMPVSLWWNSDYASSKPDGLLYAGTTEERAGFDDSSTEKGRNKIVDSVTRALPFLANAKAARQTACLRPLALDGLPVVGEMPGAEGLIIATGGGRSGIELGPGIGKIAAGIATGDSDLQLDQFAALGPDRFA